MAKKYSDTEFKKIVLERKKWVREVSGTYDSKKDTIELICQKGHSCSVDTKAIVRADKLKECPICKELNRKRFCLLCGKELNKDEKKFCSSSHAATYNNLKRNGSDIQTFLNNKPTKKSYKRYKGKYCLNCNKELKNGKKYCCPSCQKEYQYKLSVENWKNGTVVHEEKQISNTIRRYLFEKYDNKCCKCGWGIINPFTNKVPLEVHHKDGNYKNNDEENLELLCPNCHSLTATFKGSNKGHGRNNN